MNRLMRFPTAVDNDPEIDKWLAEQVSSLGDIAKRWFEFMRSCGNDVKELLHDGHPTACVTDAAFAYVNVFTAHVNVGFFQGAELSDPNEILQGTGRFMRHVKLRPDEEIDVAALTELIKTAYTDMQRRLQEE